MIGYKLVTQRKDGSIGPLFINRKQRLARGTWMQAEDHPTTGYAHRPGWHVLAKPDAPHLSKKNRTWIKVEIHDYLEFTRPLSQGGKWFLAQRMKVLE